MKKTDWFDGTVKPVRRGVYERSYAHRESKATAEDYWTGVQWLYSPRGTPCLRQERPWRGLASDPSQSKEGGK